MNPLVATAFVGHAAASGAPTDGPAAAVAAAAVLALLPLACLVIAVLALRASQSRRLGRRPIDEDDDSGWGGGGGRRPDNPPEPGGDPAWWPGFEREFAAYVAARSTGERSRAAAVRRLSIISESRSATSSCRRRCSAL